jgi:hypothetical protein
MSAAIILINLAAWLLILSSKTTSNYFLLYLAFYKYMSNQSLITFLQGVYTHNTTQYLTSIFN